MLKSISALVLAVVPVIQPVAIAADSQAVAAPLPSYADIADLADKAPVVVRAQIRKIAMVEPARAPGVRAGWGRLYVEAKTEALIAGTAPLGGALRYLVDVPLDARGKPPKLKKRSVLLFARTIAARPGELQLVAPDAQLAWDAALEARVKAILGELYAAGAPQRITGVREANHVPGDLAGAGETQIFLTAANGEPAAITVRRSPGDPVQLGVSFSELVASAGVPPRETLAWYRLACFLPQDLPQSANSAVDPADRAAAARDYAYMIAQLGTCPRTRR